jgi:hypothetical protein
MQRIILLLLIIFFLNATLFAESYDWQNVNKIPKGKTIYVMLNSGKWFTAEIQKVIDEKLVVQIGADRYDAFRKEEIQEIWIKRSSIAKSILIGTAIAAGTALTTGLIMESRSTGEDKYMFTTNITLCAAPIGASAGLFYGIANHKRGLIYKAKETIDIGSIREPHLPQINWVSKSVSGYWLATK